MGRLTATLAGKFLAFDTSPLINYIEQHAQYSPITDDLFDAIQVATALRNGAELIVTNDERWRRLTEIQVVVLRDLLIPQP